MTDPLAIAGLGLVTAAGTGRDTLSTVLADGASALGPRSRIVDLACGFTGTIPEQLERTLAALPTGEAQALCVEWATRAGAEALADAGVDPGPLGLVFATNLEDHPRSLPELADAIADGLGLGGPRLTTSMACASSLAGLSLARAVLDASALPGMLVIGADTLTPRVVGGFRQLDLIAEGPCAPFSTRLGTSLGEGAGALVIVRGSVARRSRAWLLGEGLAADGHHATRPEPHGRGTAAAVGRALACAGVDAAAVGLIAAHGTGTEANDGAELAGLVDVFGRSPPAITALKSVLGHAQGAAGAVELGGVLVGRAAEPAFVPGIANFTRARERMDAGTFVEGPQTPLPGPTVAVGAGFGGATAAAVIGWTPPTPVEAGAGADADASSIPVGIRDGWSRVAGARDWRRAIRGVDLRASDPTTRALTLAVHRAVGRHPDPAIGLVAVLRRSSLAAVARLRDEIETHGLDKTSASAFANSLIVMPAGACTRALGLLGPMAVAVADELAPLLALSWARHLLRTTPSCPAIVACVASEDGRGEGSAFACVLARDGAIVVEALTIGESIDSIEAAPLREPVATAGSLEALDDLRPGQRTTIVCREPGRGSIAAVLRRAQRDP